MFSYLISFLYTAPKGVLGHGDATFTLKDSLTPTDIPIIKDFILVQLKEQDKIAHFADKNFISIFNISLLAESTSSTSASPSLERTPPAPLPGV